jgi:hypothetical protein
VGGGPASERWTGEQVLALAPDDRSARAARTLVDPRRWSQLGATSSLVWGKCQGSGRDPYQVTVDLDEPAFRCTCPSRKHPCKHGLALLLLWSTSDGAVSDVEAAADFAGAWAGERAAQGRREDGGADGKGGAERAAVDPAAQARRQAEREALMSAGLDDFERWLFDLVRQGLAAARRQPYDYWDAAAARLVDAQVPGLAERVRGVGGAVVTRPDWAEHLLAEAGRWYLTVRAWRRRADLAPVVVADLRTALGWARRTDEVLAGERVRDRWVVVGLRQDLDPRLSSQRTWLWGESSAQLVVVLDFAAAGASFKVAHVLGSVVDAEVALYPGSPPRRALLTGDHAVVGSHGTLDGVAAGGIADGLDRVASWLAGNPWLERAPFPLRGVTAVADGGAPAVVVDEDGHSLPLSAAADVWTLLALTGGAPVDLFGEWAGDRLHPVSLMAGGRLVAV